MAVPLLLEDVSDCCPSHARSFQPSLRKMTVVSLHVPLRYVNQSQVSRYRTFAQFVTGCQLFAVLLLIIVSERFRQIEHSKFRPWVHPKTNSGGWAYPRDYYSLLCGSTRLIGHCARHKKLNVIYSLDRFWTVSQAELAPRMPSELPEIFGTTAWVCEGRCVTRAVYTALCVTSVTRAICVSRLLC